ncbi:MAG: hypothetical protein SPE18_07455 [Candidatus Limivicinus sp.]|nr:hypothetical protein [Candidatus Limivicinus sp.]
MLRKISKFLIPAAVAAIAYFLIKHVEITATVEVDTDDEDLS